MGPPARVGPECELPVTIGRIGVVGSRTWEVAVLASIFGTDSLYVLIIAVVVLFGGSQLPKLAKNAGEAMKEFRKAHNEATTPLDAPSVSPMATPGPATSSMAPQSVVLPQAVALPPVAVAQPSPAAASEDRVTLSRSELDALLADREARAKAAQGTNESQN
jgi:sec-independent protein translocase protein TatA